MMGKKIQCVDVILPLPLPKTFLYSVPSDLNEKVDKGKRVIVPFGNRKLYSGIIQNCFFDIPKTTFNLKEISAIIDEEPIVSESQLDFWNWLAEYYMCSIGEVMNIGLVSSFKLESKTVIIPNQEFKKLSDLSDYEQDLFEKILPYKKIFLKDLLKSIKSKNIFQLINKLLEKQAIYCNEVIEENYLAKTKPYVVLNDSISDEKGINAAFNLLSKSAKQRLLLDTFLNLSIKDGNIKDAVIEKEVLLKQANVGNNILKELIKKNILTIIEKVANISVEISERQSINLPRLTLAQQKAYLQLKNGIEKKDVVLFHGITSSGKTEIYFHLINEEIKKDNQVLFLLPEIAITAQMVKRLKNVFGEIVGVYHSKISESEKRKIWYSLLYEPNNGYKIILGVRSSVFLPFKKLSLIIIDEEHDSSYKQLELSPHYHARDAAIMLASITKAKVVLGSATPSVESYYNAINGKYELVELLERFGNVKPPVIQVVNMCIAKAKAHVKACFSDILVENIKENLDKGKQIILFHNRRGFVPFIQCTNCGYVYKCQKCGVTMTYHKNKHLLICHYCYSKKAMNDKCPQCSSTSFIMQGTGTEKIEEELSILFPNIRIARIDSDVLTSRNTHEKIINAFEKKQFDILIGTQMIAKCLDFENVGLVGIINADNLLQLPYYKAFEHAFQLISQVSGRAGRKNEQGKVIVQTYQPSHPVIQQIIKSDYLSMYQSQIADRREFFYPPIYRMIDITIKHRNEGKCELVAQILIDDLKNINTLILIGPTKPVIGKINNYFVRQLLIKIPKNKRLNEIKNSIYKKIQKIQDNFKTTIISINVDP
mgnify:CR=1 FL=1